jgi:RND family efflux transporter MFP subunit
MKRPTISGKRLAVNGTLLALIAGAGGFAWNSTRAESTTNTATVQTEAVTRADVVSSVSASGNIVSATDLQLNFQEQGKVIEILVNEGDRVQAGDPLARLDNTAQQKALLAAQASLASVKAKASKTTSGLSSVERAQNDASEAQSSQSLSAARISLTNATETAASNKTGYQNAVNQADRNLATAEESLATATTKAQADNEAAVTSVESARKSLDTAQANANRDNEQAAISLSNAQTTADEARRQLDANVANLRSAQALFDPNASNYAVDALSVVTRYTDDQSSCKSSSTVSDGVTCSQVAYLLQLAQALQKQESTSRSADTSLASARSSVDSTKAKGEQSITSAQNSLTTATNQQRTTKLAGDSNIANANTSVASAKEKRTDALQNQQAGELKDRQTIRTQEANVANAEKGLAVQKASNDVKEKPATPDQLAADQSSIETAENQLSTAQKNLDETTLVAPVDGVVANLGGEVGADVTTGGAATTSFITLSNPDSIKVRVGFSEADALRLRLGQNASVSLDSASERVFTGKVIAIDETQSLVNNVVTYYAEVNLVGDTAGVRIGMSATVEVIVDERKGVLTLPTRAVRGNGKTSIVQVQQAAVDGKEPTQAPTQVQVGLRGNDRVEITSGLTEGQKVVIASTGGGGLPGGLQLPGGGGLGGRGGLP